MTGGVIWSIHDVTSDTLERSREILGLLTAVGASRITILVVPGGAWSASDLETLRGWRDDGHLLAAHGWTHRGVKPRGLYHRLHSALFSRDVAEHLGRSPDQLIELVRRSQQWFDAVGLELPRLYVPPAWTLGALPLGEFHGTSFRWVETFGGIYEVETSRFRRLPLVGFEADTWLRARSLQLSNRVNLLAARIFGAPIRAAIHPDDFSLLLASELVKLLASERGFLSLDDLAQRPPEHAQALRR